VNGKVLIDVVDREKLSQAEFPFERGDEILSVDGQAIGDFISEMKRYVATGYDLTQDRIASWLVFRRPAALVPVPAKPEVEVEIRRGTSEIIEKVKLPWQDEGEGLDETKVADHLRPLFKSTSYFHQTKNRFDLLSSREIPELYMGKRRMERSYMCSGGSRVEVPKDATKLIEEPFVAYYHPTAKGNVGYLRIPHYMWQKPDDENYAYKILDKYVYAIHELEKNTVGLIIDQDHNCGGSVEYLEALVSHFMDRPVEPLLFQLRATRQTYIDIKEWQQETATDTMTHKLIDANLKLVRETWEKGGFLTPKLGLASSVILPSPIRYSKPIVMTIDELSGSGGDAFPSLMKGYGRATLVGQRTSGLGGHVTAMPSLNNSAMKIQMTRSLFYRPDGVPVENNGAVPDVEYVITRDDFLYNYKGYQKFYLNVLFQQIDKQPKPLP
jgi:hypothetical protein